MGIGDCLFLFIILIIIMSKSPTSIKLIEKQSQVDEKERIVLEITNEGTDYLNKWNSNLIGIVSIIGPQDSDKSTFAN